MPQKSREPHIITKSSERISITCHPSALSAFRCWNSVRRQSSLNNIPQQAIPYMQRADPLWVIRSGSGPNHYQFFAGFAFASAIKSKLLSNTSLLLYEGIPDEDIQEYAWSYNLKLLIFSLDHETGLGSIYNSINQHMPRQIIKSLFGRRSLSKRQIGKFCAVKDTAVRWQVDKIAAEQSPSNTSILSTLLGKK